MVQYIRYPYRHIYGHILGLIVIVMSIINITGSQAKAFIPNASSHTLWHHSPGYFNTSSDTHQDKQQLDYKHITLEAASVYQGDYRPNTWVPIRIVVQNNGPDITRQLHVHIQNSGTVYATTLDLPQGAHKVMTIYVFIPQVEHRLNVQIIHNDQVTIQQEVGLTPHPNTECLIAIVTSHGSHLPLPIQLDNGSAITPIPLKPEYLPERAQGLMMFDAVVLNDVQTATLQEQQHTALYEWVIQGGQLILGGGAGAQNTLAGLPEELRFVRITDVQTRDAHNLLKFTEVDIGDLTLAQFESSKTTTYTLPLYPLAMSVFTNSPVTEENPPLLIEQVMGQGVVTFFAVSFAEEKFATWAGLQSFWSDILRRQQMRMPGFQPTDFRPDEFANRNIASLLTELPALEYPSLFILGLLLITYILLIGPGTYIVLRLWDRQILGWIITPVITIIFALIAWGLGYAKHGNDVILNYITLIEPLHTGPNGIDSARMRTFVGLFSPTHENYSLDVANTQTKTSPPLLRPISLQGPWDIQKAPQGGVFSQEYLSAHVTNFALAQWSMRALTTDSIQPYQGIQARIIFDGTTVTGEVSNNDKNQLQDVILIQGDKIAKLGDLNPGERRSGTLVNQMSPTTDHFINNTPLGYLLYNDEMEQFGSEGNPPPRDLLLRIRYLDSLYTSRPITHGARPALFAWVNHTPLDVHIPNKRIAQKQMALITFRPELQFINNMVILEPGWMERRIEQNTENICMGSYGMGVNILNASVIMTLHLPPELATLQPTKLLLLSIADGIWPPEAYIDLFNWNTGDWVRSLSQGTAFAIGNPNQFLGSGGMLRVRISGIIPPENTSGCLYVDARIEGRLP